MIGCPIEGADRNQTPRSIVSAVFCLKVLILLQASVTLPYSPGLGERAIHPGSSI